MFLHFSGDCNFRQSQTTSLPSRLQDSIITESVPRRNSIHFRSVVTNCIDRMEEDFSHRFSSENTDVWRSMESLLPSSANFLDLTDLEPLYKYAITIPKVKSQMLSEALGKGNLDAECRVYRRVLLKEQEKGAFLHDSRNTVDLNKVCAYMAKSHIDCAPVLTILYRIAATAGYASARVECLFSALSKIDAPQRRCQTSQRESNLTFLHFERKTLMALKYDDFIKVWDSKPRKLSFK